MRVTTISRGKRAQVDALDRGMLVLSKEDECRRRRGLYQIGLVGIACLAGGQAWIFIDAYVALPSLWNASGIAISLLWGVLIGRPLVAGGLSSELPGIYEHGVQLMDDTFIPFSEIEEVRKSDRGWDGTMMMVSRHSSKIWYLPLCIVGMEGVSMAKEAIEGKGPPVARPHLVVHPTM